MRTSQDNERSTRFCAIMVVVSVIGMCLCVLFSCLSGDVP